MNFKHLIAVALLFAFLGFVSAESYMPEEGEFAFREVENYTLHGINFTVPVEYDLKDSGDDFLTFKCAGDKLKISADKHAKIRHVKSAKNVTASETMLGSQEGYLVDRNGSYTFSYMDGKYLITIESDNIPLMIGVMGKG